MGVYKVLPLWYDHNFAKRPAVPTRGFSDRRRYMGSHKRRLSDNDVVWIRQCGAWGWPRTLIAKCWGIGERYASFIVNGSTHAHVREELV